MQYICKLCGYVVDEKVYNDLTFRCPKCGVDRYNFKKFIREEIDKRKRISEDNVSINRVLNKCINCGMCKRTCESKNNVLESECINCGACILTCPTGALTPVYDYNKVYNEINDKDKIVVCFVAPGVKAGINECFNLEIKDNLEEKLVTALKGIGFDYVFDTCFGADITVIEETRELIERKSKDNNLPMFTSCCPSWVKYLNIKHSELIENLSTTKSPNAIMGALVKSYFAKEKGIDPSKIVTVGIVPCTSKKYEAKRNDLVNNNLANIDYALTTTEIAIMLKENNIDLNTLVSSNYDKLLAESSGSGNLFARSGGVLLSVFRCLNYILTSKELDEKDLLMEKKEEYTLYSLTINKVMYKAAVVTGIVNAEKLINKIKNKEEILDIVEVMTCESGCVSGAGQALQNINKLESIYEERTNKINEIDKNKQNKISIKNKEVNKLYNKYLNKKLTYELLHTK